MPTLEDESLQPITDPSLLLGPTVTLDEEMPEDHQVEPSGPDDTSIFDVRHRDPFTGLLFIGKLSKEVKIFGHSFSLETPTESVRLETGLLHKKYLNTLSTERAWAAILVAAYLQSVDGSELPQPIGPKDTGLQDRFNWVLDNLKRDVIQKVFEQCLILDGQVNEIIQELERVGEE